MNETKMNNETKQTKQKRAVDLSYILPTLSNNRNDKQNEKSSEDFSQRELALVRQQ
jgi:hypothetical protein